jgi:hypothetical protein
MLDLGKKYDMITSSSLVKPNYETNCESEQNLNVDKSWWKLHIQIIFKVSNDDMECFQHKIQMCTFKFFENDWNY